MQSDPRPQKAADLYVLMRLCSDGDGGISAPLTVVCEGFVDSITVFHCSFEAGYRDYKGHCRTRYQYPHDLLKSLAWYRENGVECYGDAWGTVGE